MDVDASSLNAIHMETGLVAVPLNNIPTIVPLKGITPTMETIYHKERKQQRVQQCPRVEQPQLSPPRNNQCSLPAYFPSIGPCTDSTWQPTVIDLHYAVCSRGRRRCTPGRR